MERKQRRLEGYDYSQAGAYFVTLVCNFRELILADPGARRAVEESWLWLARYGHVRLDHFVVMPNHLHGVVFLVESSSGGSRTATTGDREYRKPLGRIIGAFKTVSTQRVNALRNTPGATVWQRDFFDRIIRNEGELNRIRQYILDNPANWNLDPENPVATGESAATALFSC